MKIKLVSDCVTPNGFGHTGDVMELTDAEARLLIRMGRAIVAPEEIPEVAKPEAPARGPRRNVR